MIHINCIVECDNCHKAANAIVQQLLTSPILALMGSMPSQTLRIPKKKSTAWRVDNVGKTFCSKKCHEADEKKKQEQAPPKEKTS